MKIRMGSFLLPSAGATPAEFERGYAGQNPDFYQRGLRDCARLLRQLDDLGFDFVAFSEHHFHLEGLEDLEQSGAAWHLGGDADQSAAHRPDG